MFVLMNPGENNENVVRKGSSADSDSIVVLDHFADEKNDAFIETAVVILNSEHDKYIIFNIE